MILENFLETYTVFFSKVSSHSTFDSLTKFGAYVEHDTFNGEEGWGIIISKKHGSNMLLLRATYVANIHNISDIFPFVFYKNHERVGFNISKDMSEYELELFRKNTTSIDELILEINNDHNT